MTINTNTDMRAALIEARDWFESQAKAVSKGCGSSYELHDLRTQRDALDAALAAPAQPAAPAQAGELSEQDSGLLEQAASMLDALANDERNRGNCSTAEGAACSAHAVRRLASTLLSADRAARGAAQALDAQELRTVARAIWEVMREYEDRCDLELEDIGCSHVVWQLANAAIAAQQGAKP